MDMHLEHRGWRVVPSALAVALLAACGGSGGGSGMVRSDPPVESRQPPPPPPPPPAPIGCTGPQSADCVVDVPANYFGHPADGGRDSDYALVKIGEGGAALRNGVYRFGGGTRIEAGVLEVAGDAILQSDVANAARLSVVGEVRGDLINHGAAWLSGTIDGHVSNLGRFTVDASDGTETDAIVAVVTGDYTQASTASLGMLVGGATGGTLSVGGEAHLDGTVDFSMWDNGWYGVPVPATPYTHHVLTAAGGVSGTFDGLSTGSLFIGGTLRYEPNDVWFEVAATSAAAVMQHAAAGDAMTHNAARAYDRILAVADTLPRDAAQLSQAQRRFLLSAATIQRIGDLAQAVRTFDSISGHGHLAAIDAQLQHALQSAPRIGAHAGRVPLHASGAWSASPDVSSVRGASFAQGQAFGYDAWIGERLLLGGRVDQTDSVMAVDREGGVARGRAPAVHLSLHRVGNNGWHTTGLLGASRQTMRLERPIDLGAARGAALSERNTDLAYAWVETGRDIRTEGGTITPFASLGYAAMHGDAFVEYGNTGFELAGLPSRYERLQGDAGVRYAKGWRWGGDGWSRLGLGARWRHAFYANDTLQVAFTGAPQVMFDVAGMPMARTDRLWELDFTGGVGDRWSWTMRYEDGTDDRALSLGMALGF